MWSKALKYSIYIIFIGTLSAGNTHATPKAKYDIDGPKEQEKTKEKKVRTSWVIGDVFSYSMRGAYANYKGRQGRDIYKSLNPYSAIGVVADSYSKGIDLAIEEINNSGGINKKPLVRKTKDDKRDKGTARKVTEQLLHEGVDVLMGTFDESTSTIVQEYAEREKTLFLSLGAYTTHQRAHKYTYAMRIPAQVMGKKLAVTATQTKAKRWAVLIPPDQYGKALHEAFKENIARHDKKIEVLKPLESAAFQKITTDTLMQLAKEKPDGILIGVYGQDLISLMQIKANSRALFFNDKEVLCVFCGSSDWLYYIGKKMPDEWKENNAWYGEMQTKHYQEFVRRYKAKYKESPLEIAALSYTAVYTAAAYLREKDNTHKKAEPLKGVQVQSPWGMLEFSNEHTPIYTGDDEQSL